LLDADFIDRGLWTVLVLAKISNLGNFRSLRAVRVLLLHGLLSRLGWNLFLWEPLLCFSNGFLRSRPGHGTRNSRGKVSQPRGCFRLAWPAPEPFCRLEHRIDFSVGSAPNSSPRTGVLEYGRTKSISRGAKRNIFAATILSFSANRRAASDRAARHRGAETR